MSFLQNIEIYAINVSEVKNLDEGTNLFNIYLYIERFVRLQIRGRTDLLIIEKDSTKVKYLIEIKGPDYFCVRKSSKRHAFAEALLQRIGSK